MKHASGDPFVDCRLLGHSWYSIEAERNPKVGWYMKLRCERCGTERSDIVDRDGVVGGRSYTYAEGYKLARTEQRTRTEWRIEFLRRLVPRARKSA